MSGRRGNVLMSPGGFFASYFLLLLGRLFTCAGFARADNPIVQNIYTTDPAPIVHEGRVFAFTGHDEDNSTWYTMLDWRLFSSADMVNWQHHGSPMSLNTFAWANADAWAGQVIARNDKFYFYAPVRHGATATKAIGVGVSDNITGPYTDALGHPLVENGAIDPTVYIDDDGQAYLYWGNPGLWYVKLNEDMISYSGSVTPVDLTVEGFGSPNEGSDEETSFDEAPWIYKRDDIYYMIFAGNCCPENIRYSTGTSITGPWTYQGVIMPTQGASFTNHPGIVDFADRSYFFYHNGALPGGSGYTRSVAVEEFTYNSDGTIPEINMTEDGPAQVGNLDPYSRQEAETIAWSDGIDVESSSDGGIHVAYINNGDYIKVKGVAFGDGASSFAAGVASAGNGGHIELRLDSKDGTAIGTCSVPITGGWQAWETVNCSISDATSTHDLFFVFTGDTTIAEQLRHRKFLTTWGYADHEGYRAMGSAFYRDNHVYNKGVSTYQPKPQGGAQKGPPFVSKPYEPTLMAFEEARTMILTSANYIIEEIDKIIAKPEQAVAEPPTPLPCQYPLIFKQYLPIGVPVDWSESE